VSDEVEETELKAYVTYYLHLPRMCSSLLSKTTFWSLMDLAVGDLLPETPDSLPEYFIGLPVIGIQFMF